MKVILFLLSLGFCSYNVTAQITAEYSSYEVGNDLYAFPDFNDVDTSKYVNKRYSNGQIIQRYFLNPNNKTDSMFRYFENGSIAFYSRGLGVNKVLRHGRISFFPNTYHETYRTGGEIRSAELLVITKNNVTSSFEFYLEGELTYVERVILNDTLDGFFYTQSESGLVYSLFENGINKEMWYFADIHNKIIVNEVQVFKKNKWVKLSRRKLAKHLRKRKFHYIDGHLFFV